MFKIKQMFLYLLAGISCSCEQNPARYFPKEMQEGVLKTGFQHFSNFNDVLVEKLIKIDVIGRNDLILEFAEGILHSYNIRFKLLNNFSSKYELIIKDNPFIELKDSQWSYDSKKQRGTLKWKPSETFNWRQKYVKISLPLSIQAKKLGPPNKGSIVTINREFTAIVYKNYTPPKISKIKMEHDSYVNLSDGKFYRDYLLSGLNLNFYDSLYLGEKKRLRVNNNFIFWTLDVYLSLNSMSDYSDVEWSFMSEDKNPAWEAIGLGKYFDIVALTDSFGENVPIEIVPFLKEPYYQAIKKKEAGKACLTEKTDFLDPSLCLAPLTELDSVGLSTALYVKHYNIPSHIQREHLYYKIESQALCGIYHKISSDFLIHRQKKWKLQKNCYLSLAKLNVKEVLSLDQLSLKNIPITEKTDIYILKENNSFEQVDKSKWKLNFYRLPEHIKWQLGGRQPVSSIIFPVNLIRKEKALNLLAFHFKDTNHSEPPYLIFEEKYHTLPQNIPVKWTLQYDVEKITEDEWKKLYSVKLIDSLEEKEYTQLYEFPFSVKPISADLAGASVDLKFNVLPSVQVNRWEVFDPSEDFKISTQIKKSNNLLEWIGTDISIEGQIKEEYVFAGNFKENILKALPGLNGQKSLIDLLDVKTHKPVSKHACASVVADDFFKERACECSGFVSYEKELSDTKSKTRVLGSFLSEFSTHEKELSDTREESDDKQRDKPIYMKSICSYKTKLKLNAEQTNKDNQIISAYWKYDYSIDTSIFLKSVSADGKSHSRQALSVNREYLREYPLANKQGENFSFHIFFNLQPKINCFSELDSSNKTCQIRYYLDQVPESVKLPEFNKDRYFFSDQGLQADMACLNSDSEEMKDCMCEGPEFVVEYEDIGKAYGGPGGEAEHAVIKKLSFLEIKCSMGKTQKGFLDLALKTKSPYIYFLDPEVEDDIKSAVLKRLPVE